MQACWLMQEGGNYAQNTVMKQATILQACLKRVERQYANRSREAATSQKNTSMRTKLQGGQSQVNLLDASWETICCRSTSSTLPAVCKWVQANDGTQRAADRHSRPVRQKPAGPVGPILRTAL